MFLRFSGFFNAGCAEFVISGKLDADFVDGSECTRWSMWELGQVGWDVDCVRFAWEGNGLLWVVPTVGEARRLRCLLCLARCLSLLVARLLTFRPGLA